MISRKAQSSLFCPQGRHEFPPLPLHGLAVLLSISSPAFISASRLVTRAFAWLLLQTEACPGLESACGLAALNVTAGHCQRRPPQRRPEPVLSSYSVSFPTSPVSAVGWTLSSFVFGEGTLLALIPAFDPEDSSAPAGFLRPLAWSSALRSAEVALPLAPLGLRRSGSVETCRRVQMHGPASPPCRRALSSGGRSPTPCVSLPSASESGSSRRFR